MAKLCEMCSRLDFQSLTRSLYPCHNPLPCSTPPTELSYVYSPLGPIDEIKSRRFACDICKLIAESLDKEPQYLNGECRITEIAQFCNFKLPGYIKARDPSITHFHFTQVAVIFDTSVAEQFRITPPWELKARDIHTNHYVLNLQVKAKAKSCTKVGDLTAPSLQTEQDFLDTIGGRRVTTQVNPQLIRAWLHQCESKHGGSCMPSLQHLAEREREPTFVIDVFQSCLVDTPLRCRYVALSYVWGTAPIFRHLLENTHDLRKTTSLCSLPIPATIRDAITLVRAIGERYLWVDSICIVQNDLKTHQAETMRMGSIYSNALFTIIAAAGDHANSGIPGVERESREQVQKILRLADHELLTVIDIRKTPSGIDNTVWAQRAWTFQERAVSNRVLVFSESQVYWSCRAALHSEEQALEEVQDIDRHHLSFPQQTTTNYLSWEPLQALEYCDIYSGLLYTYRQRCLTYQTDLLNAFNGIFKILAALQDDTFLWGLPESLFSIAMVWSFASHYVRNYVNVPVFNSIGSEEVIPIPSWSWAAWSGANPNRPLFLYNGDRRQVRPVIHFSIVNEKHQLVRIKERSWHQGDHVPTLWKNEQPPSLQTLTQHSASQIGQLYFWTSLAKLRAVRSWGVHGLGEVQYTPFPPPDFQPDPNSTHRHTEIVHQDFIVVAAGGPETLILLAIEWRDGVAYRVGQTHAAEEDWVQVENREWRLIILG